MKLDPIEKIFKPASSLKLDEKKKEVIHQELLLFMKNNPVKVAVFASYFNAFKFRKPAFALASLMLVFSAFGVASVQADSSLPGDWLYPMKVGVNEKVKQVLAFSDDAKLNLNIELAEVRLQEAEKLAAKGKMNKTNEAKINSSFKEHAAKASVKLKVKKEKALDNEKLEKKSANFEASLKAHSVKIDELQKKAADQVVQPLRNDIDNVVSEIAKEKKEKKNKEGLDLKINNLLK